MDLLDKVHSHNTSHGAIGQSIRDIAGIVGQTPLDIVVHAPEETQWAQTLPSRETLVGVYGFLRHVGTMPMTAEHREGNGESKGGMEVFIRRAGFSVMISEACMEYGCRPQCSRVYIRDFGKTRAILSSQIEVL